MFTQGATQVSYPPRKTPPPPRGIMFTPGFKYLHPVPKDGFLSDIYLTSTLLFFEIDARTNSLSMFDYAAGGETWLPG